MKGNIDLQQNNKIVEEITITNSKTKREIHIS
jgi:hypothetical protein